MELPQRWGLLRSFLSELGETVFRFRADGACEARSIELKSREYAAVA